MKRMAFGLLVGSLQLTACSSDNSSAPQGVSGGCTGSLDEVRAIWGTQLRCPDVYDATLDASFGCVLSPSSVEAGLAGSLLVARFTINLSGGACYYDASTRRLVGAMRYGDTPTFCGGTSAEIHAGTTPGTCVGPVPSGCELSRTDRSTNCQRPSGDAGADGG